MGLELEQRSSNPSDVSERSVEQAAIAALTSALIQNLEQQVRGGFLYMHHRANANTSKTLEVTAFAYALIELLIEKGVLTEAELNDRKRQVAERMGEKFRDHNMGVVRQEPEYDKYSYETQVKIDCENRLHLCRAACCRLQFALSRQDVEEGIVKWDFANPYLIQHNQDGNCVHLDACSHRCSVYEHRPLPCRAYDCRNDSRIWQDFEHKIVSPELETLFTQNGNRP